jgi:threonine dehydrogenase-like Zn-dependent dehydrogenase
MAKKMGAHAGFLSDDPDLQAKLDEFTLGNGIDLVILTANPWPAYRTACEIVRRGGRISIVALSGRGEADLDFNPLWSGYFYDKGISLIAASGETEDTYPSETGKRWSPERRGEHILGLMEDDRLQPSRLITHRMHYTETVKAYRMMETRDKNMLGVVFDWTDAVG